MVAAAYASHGLNLNSLQLCAMPLHVFAAVHCIGHAWRRALVSAVGQAQHLLLSVVGQTFAQFQSHA